MMIIHFFKKPSPRGLLLLLVAFFILPGYGQNTIQSTGKELLILPPTDAAWWTGVISQGSNMPIFEGFNIDMNGSNYYNQIQPLMISNQGEVVWNEEPIAISYFKDTIRVVSRQGKIQYVKAGNNLRDAYMYANKHYFRFDGKTPDKLLFEKPQYNTWIELMYDQNEADILKYAQSIIDNGFPPGVLMIDDNWQEDYGSWTFHPGRFKNPKGMIAKLHDMGFKVMLWVCPFISGDSENGREVIKKGLVVVNKEGKPVVTHWWNGYSLVLDLSNPAANEWFKSALDHLVAEYGVDGYKFDAGDAEYYTGDVSFFDKNATANSQSELYGRIGLNYPLNEYRALWKMGGYPLANRLGDKQHKWSDLKLLIPNMIIEGLMGYAYSCPDMIGGGEFSSFLNASKIDQELIVRSAQCHALMPMMQFSVAPWRILDQAHFNAVKQSVELREQFIDYIMQTVNDSSQSGEPILRSMEYNFPHSGYTNIKDQFMIGESLLVAPVLEKGASTCTVVLPEGIWVGFDGKKIKGPKKVEIPVTINTIPYYKRIK